MSILNRTTEAIRAALKSAGSIKDDAQRQANTLNRDIELTKRKRDAVRTQPADKSDIKAAMRTYLAECRSVYLGQLSASLRPFFVNPANLRSPRELKRLLTVAGVASPESEFVNRADVDGCLAALFADQLGPLMDKAIDDCQGPDAGGLSLAKRDAAMAQLDTEIQGLQEQLDQLIQDAAAAGVVLELERHF